ncbi:Hypothetical protein PBC10988_11140 [Planctomycetales bacterium 10988]|nr:Hypothetical protein PBC10988_11140 [Planctomycetales bacterium 10988]
MECIARHYQTGTPTRIVWQGNQITQVSPIHDPELLNANLPWVSPGFWDLNCHGMLGQNFASPQLTPDRVQKIVEECFRFGITHLFPTLTTNTSEVFEHSLEVITTACKQSNKINQAIQGIHLEGPYLSEEEVWRPDHQLDSIRPALWEEVAYYQKIAEGRIRLLTLSLESLNNEDFLEQAILNKIVLGLTKDSLRSPLFSSAVEKGAAFLEPFLLQLLESYSTNHLIDFLLEDRLMACLVGDGFSLDERLLKTLLKAKGSLHCFLASCMTSLTGLPPGDYQLQGVPVSISDSHFLHFQNKAKDVAGVITPLSTAIANCVNGLQISLADAISLVTSQPAKLLQQPIPTLFPGSPADLVVFYFQNKPHRFNQSTLEIVTTILNGEVVYGYLD